MLAAMFLGTSCESYLERQPDDALTSENIFEKRSTTFKYLVNVYSWMPDVTQLRGYDSGFYNVTSDLVTLAFPAGFYTELLHNEFSAAEGNGIYTNMYYGIREATYFMQNVDRCPELSEAEIRQYKAEARFLRAFYYTELLRLFGPVILLGEDMVDFNEPGLDEYDRTPWDECVEWVCNEYDTAAADLPKDPFANNGEYGRATQGAALGMKARLLVYNARPLFNGQNGTGMYRNVVNRFGEPLFSTSYDAKKWEAARDALKAVIDLNKYSLNYDPAKTALANIHDTFILTNSKENVFARQDNNGYDVRISCRPEGTGFGGNAYGSLAPTQKLVDAFAMESGVYPVTNIEAAGYQNGLNPEIDSESGYVETGAADIVHPVFKEFCTEPLEDAVRSMKMFENREARFYANVFWSGLSWAENGGKNVKKNIGFYKGGSSSGTNNYPPTGYLSLKFVEPSNGGGNFTAVSWPILRYADILLMYSEALIETGDLEGALETWNMVRERAGVPDIETLYSKVTSDKETALKYLRQERMVEFCIEGVRYFDARTWMTAEVDFTGEVVGCNIMADNHNVGGDFWNRTSIFDCRGEGGLFSRRNFTKRNYLFPIPQAEINRVPGMTQNLGW